MSINEYLDYISKAIKHGVCNSGSATIFECLLDEYLRVLYR